MLKKVETFILYFNFFMTGLLFVLVAFHCEEQNRLNEAQKERVEILMKENKALHNEVEFYKDWSSDMVDAVINKRFE